MLHFSNRNMRLYNDLRKRLESSRTPTNALKAVANRSNMEESKESQLRLDKPMLTIEE